MSVAGGSGRGWARDGAFFSHEPVSEKQRKSAKNGFCEASGITAWRTSSKRYVMELVRIVGIEDVNECKSVQA